MDNLYSVHRYFNEKCRAIGILPELVVDEDNLKAVLSTESLSEIMPRVKKHAIANGIIVELREVSAGTLVIISDSKINVAPIVGEVETKYGKFYRRLNEAIGGIAVPDGNVQPKHGVEMLELALGAKTKAGLTLKDALKKQDIKWNVAEPGSHVVVFTGKNGDEKWRVEPMTLSDKKTFEQTMESLWSIALGKAPNAKELEREAAQQRAQELRDHQKEITGLVDTIVGKYTKPDQEEV